MSINKIRSADLSPLSIVAQCLDNQWLPPALSEKVNDKSGLASLGGERTDLIKRELIGTILTSEQIIINRANLYNNDFFQEIINNPKKYPEEVSGIRQAFSENSMVVFLYDETSLGTEVKFHTDDTYLNNLRALLSDVDVSCLRFDWDSDEVNRRIIKKNLGRRFHNFVHDITGVNKEILAKSFGISEKNQKEFNRRLRELSSFAHDFGDPDDNEEEVVTRSAVYEHFVSPNNKKHDEGFIDHTKPFSREIKKIVDLKYNCNLPDALSRYAITADGDIDRTVLQEERGSELAGLEKFTRNDEGALIDILCRGAFDEFATFNSFSFLEKLSISEALSMKKTGAWRDYAELVKNILPTNNSGALEEHAIFKPENLRALGAAHAELLLDAGRRIESREAREEVRGWWEFGVSLAATGLSFASELFGHGKFEIPEDAQKIFAESTSPILWELTWNTTHVGGKKRAIRKYPLLKKRVEDPIGMFRRTMEKLDEYKRRKRGGELTIGTLTEEEIRAADRRNTLNLPE